MRALHSKSIPGICGLLVQALFAVPPSWGGEPNPQQVIRAGDVEVTGEAVIWQKEQQLDTRIREIDYTRDSHGAVHVIFYAYTPTEDLMGKGALVYVAISPDKPISEQHPQPHVFTESTVAHGSWSMTTDGKGVSVAWLERPALYRVVEDVLGGSGDVTSVNVEPLLGMFTTVGYLKTSRTLLLAGSLPTLDVHVSTSAFIAVNVPKHGEVVHQFSTIVRGDQQIKRYVHPLFEGSEGVMSFCTFTVDKTAPSPYQMLHYALGGTPLRARLVHQWGISGYPVYSEAFFVGKRCIVVWHEMGDIDPAPLFFIDSERTESAAILDPGRSVRCSQPAGVFRDSPSGVEGFVVWSDEHDELVGRRYLDGHWSPLLRLGTKAGAAIAIEEIEDGRYLLFTGVKTALKGALKNNLNNFVM